jgi:hypothetical protein
MRRAERGGQVNRLTRRKEFLSADVMTSLEVLLFRHKMSISVSCGDRITNKSRGASPRIVDRILREEDLRRRERGQDREIEGQRER